MANCYVKAFYDWIEQTAALSDAERGRLFIAVLEYARSGQLPELSGRESILFPVFQSQIDRDNAISSARSEAGKTGVQAKLSKRKQTQANASKNANKEKEKEEDKDKDKDKISPPSPPRGELDAAMDDFSEFRKRIRKPLTDRARELTLAELEKLAPGDEKKKIAILNQSIQRGWQGVFPLKTEPKQKTGTFGKDSRWGTEADSQGFDDLSQAERMYAIK